MLYDIFKHNKEMGDIKFISACKNKFNKQKKVISTFSMLFKSVPLKPKRVIDLITWKGEHSSCINDGITVVQDFMKKLRKKQHVKRLMLQR